MSLSKIYWDLVSTVFEDLQQDNRAKAQQHKQTISQITSVVFQYLVFHRFCSFTASDNLLLYFFSFCSAPLRSIHLTVSIINTSLILTAMCFCNFYLSLFFPFFCLVTENLWNLHPYTITSLHSHYTSKY